MSCKFLLGLALTGTATAQQTDAEAATDPVAAAVLRVEPDQPLPISRLDLPPEDLGLAGAELALEDNRTTGAFLGQEFTLEARAVGPEEAESMLRDLLDAGVDFIVTLADAPTTLALADAAGSDALVLNARAPDDELRGEACRANLLHVAPSRRMLTDALAQFLVWKRWSKWFLIEGSHPQDTALADAYRASAEKFGAQIVETRVFEDTGGARRTDSGLVQVQAQLPVFTQRAAEHDVVIVADESEVFAAYIPYHTWTPRPIAGSAGLEPLAWHPAHEAWGATQLQRRFEREAGRPMEQEDYAAWLAMRVIGEAATRTGGTEPGALRDYILSDAMEVAGFKGQALSFRSWNRQLRQPILLADAIVSSVSPQEGFVHQVSPLDTLGIDAPESDCATQ